MVLHILRALFVLLMASVGWFFLRQVSAEFDESTWIWRHSEAVLMITLALGVLIVCIDILAPRKKLAIFSGTFLGLMVGLVTAYALSFVVSLLVDHYLPPAFSQHRLLIVEFVDLVVGIICCYLAISFILQTKDDFRFVIPYVEFSRQTKGARPILLDTSVLIDGRIGDMVETGIFESQLIVPQFVINELQAIADSGERLKRNRGRRGLDVLAALRAGGRAEVHLYESTLAHRNDTVDEQLVALARELDARVITNDFNLNKVAQVRGVSVININELANALKPAALPGERMTVRIVKPGESPGQGVGYLTDGTMVVVEGGRDRLDSDVELVVTNAMQTSAGRMIFGRLLDGVPAPHASASGKATEQSDPPEALPREPGRRPGRSPAR